MLRPWFIDRPKRSLLRERIFQFSSNSLSKLKAKVNYECNTTKISTLQALSAFVWRSVTRAQRLPRELETSCRMADNRERLSPPLPETYFVMQTKNRWSING
ncbi:putative shikimate O-hydroxycinnamoyltransferase [Helianthus anomalus]